MLLLALIAAAAAAAAKITYAIFLGKVMDVVAPFGAGSTGKEAASTSVSYWCTILAAAGAANWAASSMFITTWGLFGELMTRAARRVLFTTLLHQDMAWFDLQKQSIRVKLSRIHM